MKDCEELVENTIKFIKDRIEFIEADSRYQDKPALVQTNAPLALIQVSMKSEINTLKIVLKMLEDK